MQVWFLFGSSPESLLWLEKRAAKLWGVQQHLSSEPPCQAEELWGTGSLPGDAGLVVFVTLPQWHWCLLMLPSSCTKKSCKTFQLITEVIKHSSPSSGCVPSGSPAGEMLFFLIQPTQTHPYSFHRAGLAARSFGLRFLQRIGGRRAARWTGSSQPVRVLAALSFLGAVQARDLSHKARSASFPFGSRLSLVSFLHTSLLCADWTTPIHLIFPHKLYLSHFSNNFIWSFQNEKLVTEVQNHCWEKQTTPFLVGRLFSCWGLMFVCFTFQNHAIPASYSGIVVAQPVFYQAVLGHLFPSNLSKLMTVDRSGSSKHLQKALLLPVLSETQRLGFAWLLPDISHRLISVPAFPSPQELLYFMASQSSALAAAAIHPEVHLVTLSWVWND